ncbi:uncharacterized protein LOC131221078 isoform X2 [Magnolia sinica]|nr:uncharacterized protein LOC131221078 isoform X2 [Magnolia sinica]
MFGIMYLEICLDCHVYSVHINEHMDKIHACLLVLPGERVEGLISSTGNRHLYKINQTLTGSNCKKVYRCWNLHSNAGNCDQIARFFYSSGKLFSYKESSAQELAQMFIQELALE